MKRVLFLHGFAGAPAMWNDIVAATGVDAQCAVLPGHGAEPAGMTGDFSSAVERLCALVVADQPFVVVGYSLGARLALGIAARLPRATPLLIGAHAGLAPEERAERRRWEAEQASVLRRDGVSRFLDTWEKLPIFATQSERVRELQRPWREQHTAEGLAWAMETLGLGRMPDYRHAARGRWVTGELDHKFTALAAAWGVDHRIVPGVGHNVALEAPEVVVQELIQQCA